MALSQACCLSGGHGRVTFVSLFSCVGALLFGLDMGYIGPILDDPQFKRDVVHMEDWANPAAQLRSLTAGFIVGAFALGCILTSCPVISSLFLDRLGRKVSIMIGAVVFALGAGLQMVAGSAHVFILGRVVAGCSIGVLSTAVPLYQAEIAPPELRGSLASLFQVMIIIGVVVAALLDQLLLPLDDGWRIAIGVQMVPALVLFLGMVPLPRSPRWLVQQGREEEARRALRKFTGEARAEVELKEIVESFEAERQMGDAPWSEILTGRGLRLLAIGVALQLLQQLQGINAIIMFGPRIFRAINLLDANSCQTITNAVLLLGTLPAPLLMDRVGRRTLLAWSAALQGLPSLVIGIAGLTSMAREGDGWRATNEVAGWATAIAVLVYVFNFGYGWGPTTWVYCGEMFPLRCRSRCAGLTTMSNWLGVYIVGQMTPVLLETFGFGAFLLFSGFSLLAYCLAVWLPETKGVVLELVDDLFDEKLGARSKLKGGGATCESEADTNSGEGSSSSPNAC